MATFVTSIKFSQQGIKDIGHGNSTFVAAVFSRLNAATVTGSCLLPAFPSCDCFLRKI